MPIVTFRLSQVFICGNGVCFQLAKLPTGDMKAVENMKLFGFGGSADRNKSSSETFSLAFDIQKVNVSTRCFLSWFNWFCNI